MGRKPTPSPGKHEPEVVPQLGCIALLIFIIVIMSHGDLTLKILTIPLIIVILCIVYFMVKSIYLQTYGIRSVKKLGYEGILVYSNSPNWKEYIEQEWMPKIGSRLVILNWSDKKKWTGSMPEKLFYHYVGHYSTNYNPAIILFRGFRYPLVFRFFFAFRDAKHNNLEALNMLEQRLFTELNR